MRALLLGTSLLLLGCAVGLPYSARLIAPNGQPAIASEGATYEIEFLNATKEKVGLTVSVDGLDVMNGQPMGWSREAILQRGGYVVDANSIVHLTGFSVSASSFSSFRFVDAALAYASQRGAPQDVGKIEIGIYGLRSRPPYLGEGQYAAPTLMPPSSSAPTTMFGQLIADAYPSDTDHEQDPDRKLGHLVLSYGGHPARVGTAGPPPVMSAPPVVTQPAIDQKPPTMKDKPAGKPYKPRKKHIDDWKG